MVRVATVLRVPLRVPLALAEPLQLALRRPMGVRSANAPRAVGPRLVDDGEAAGGSRGRRDHRDGPAEGDRQEGEDELLCVGRRAVERLADEDRRLEEQHRADAEPERVAPDEQRRGREGAEGEAGGLGLGRAEPGGPEPVAAEPGDGGGGRDERLGRPADPRAAGLADLAAEPDDEEPRRKQRRRDPGEDRQGGRPRRPR